MKRLIRSITCLTSVLFLVTLGNPAVGGCNINDLPLAKKALAGQLSERQQEVFAARTKTFFNVAEEYKDMLDSYLEITEREEPSEQLNEELFSKGILLVQVALEYYAYLNEGPYPPNAGALTCDGLLEDFPYDPYTNLPMHLFGIGAMDRIDNGLIYVPEYVKADEEIHVVGYWLIAIAPIKSEDEPMPLLLKPLPGDINLPDSAYIVYESHME